MTMSFEQHAADLTGPDWIGAMDQCNEGELRFIEEMAVKWSALEHAAVAGVGRALFQQVQQWRALRRVRQARMDGRFWAIAGEESGIGGYEAAYTSDLPPWSEMG